MSLSLLHILTSAILKLKLSCRCLLIYQDEIGSEGIPLGLIQKYKLTHAITHAKPKKECQKCNKIRKGTDMQK